VSHRQKPQCDDRHDRHRAPLLGDTRGLPVEADTRATGVFGKVGRAIQQRLEIEYAAPECDHYGVGTVAGIEFWQDALHVGLHGALGDVEFGGNSFV
jgi:hypothetical protein